jgi:hypothetical protein
MVFGSRSSSGFSTWAVGKADRDARIAALTGKPLEPWVLHDARRSFVTHIGELGFAQPHVIEAIVNHVSGSKAGVAGVYNWAVYLEERRKALEQWGAYIVAMVANSKVQLRRTQQVRASHPHKSQDLAVRGTPA